MAYYVVLILQLVGILLALYAVSTMIHFRLGMDSRYLLISACLVTIYSTGYLSEMTATNMETAIAAMGFQYLGAAFLGVTFSMFLCEYCRVKVKRKVWIVLSSLCIAFFLLAITGQYHELFFISYEWSTEGYHPHIETRSGIGFVLFYITQLILCINAFLLVIHLLRNETSKKEKQKIRLVLATCCFPLIGVIGVFSPKMEGYEPTSFLMALSIFFLTYFVTHFKMINVVNRAYSSLFRDLEEGVIIVDSDKNYLNSNAAVNYIFPEIKSWEPGHHMSDLDIDLCEFGRKPPFERNGRHFLSVSKPIIEQRKQVGYLIVINDVTELIFRMEEMERLMSEAENANQAKSAFLANLSHEIRTPLNAIIGMSEIAERETSVEVIKDYISQIRASGKMLLDLLCETLDLSKAEAGKLDLVPTEFDTLAFFNAVINVINMRIGEKNVDFLVDIDPDIPQTLLADDIRLRQILINFLGNAEKYTQSGSITLKVDFEIVSAKDILLMFSVKDTGQGIKEENIEMLFKPFNRVDMFKNRQIVGTGLGLAISAELIELMGGRYKAESVYGEGSEFSFEVPITVVSPNPMCLGIKREKIKTPKCRTFFLYGIKEEKKENDVIEEMPKYKDARVLVVDDNKVNVKVLCAYLKQYDITADFCYSGPEAIEKAENKDYDLILLDHMMPGMDGSETASHIRESAKEWNHSVPIIACSANVIKGADEMFISSGMTDFISKPIQINILTRKIVKYLGNKE